MTVPAEPRNVGGTIVRRLQPWEDQYTTVPNAWVRDTSLSLKARGLLALLLSHRDGYRVTLKALAEDGHGGLAQLRAAVLELEAGEYLRRLPTRAASGKYGTVWELSDPPADRVRKSHAAPPSSVDRVRFPDAVNRTHKETQPENETATQTDHRSEDTVPTSTPPCPKHRFLPCSPTPAGTCADCGQVIA